MASPKVKIMGVIFDPVSGLGYDLDFGISTSKEHKSTLWLNSETISNAFFFFFFFFFKISSLEVWWEFVGFSTCLLIREFTSVRTRQNFQARALGDFHDRVLSATRAWGHKFSSEAMHVYMGENRFSLWSYHIGTVFKRSQLSFDIYKVSNHHLIHDIHQMTSGLPNLYKFQWAITSSLSYVGILAWEHQDSACRLVVANVTFQYPAAPLRILQFLSMCNDNVPLFGGGLPLDVLSILQAAGHNVVMGLWG